MEKKFNQRNDILEILFANRNKDYGAYELRVMYNKRMKYALSAMFLLCLLFTVGSILANAKSKKDNLAYVGPEIELTNIEEQPPVEEVKPPEPKVEEPQTATEVLTPPKIVQDEMVKEDDVMQEVEVYNDVKIGLQKIEGTADIGIVEPPVELTTGVTKGIKSKENELDEDFKSVQIAAEFPGGIKEWQRFLERNLNSDLPTENGAPTGVYTVTVSFVVDTEGKVSDVKAENDPGYGTKDEAIRVIKRGPKWIPANQNGRPVVYRHKQMITFKVTEQ
ncbi:energy transducer TonB [Sediminibacterium goheungense]|uniref:Protein TonB n=1 Tax=Sediminibacterium goheungense TaxID=1086393 RepID=A0A4R6J0V7_9BACT|nr:energy transducer TonB [Sediminibacterium goheungense]TDO28859.1 protein TonB [Sediminibacterium goheungense]